MSEQRPAHDQVDATWRSAPAVKRYAPNGLNPTWSTAFTVTASWDVASLGYLAVAEWARDEAATRYSVALQKNGEIVSSASTTDTNHVFSGLTPHTSYVVALTPYSGDEPGVVQYQDVATGAGLPGAMDGVDYTFTETSLTPEWPAVEDAGGYVVALFRDELELDRADVADTSVTFEGLEDGTRYTLSFYAYNPQGRGPETTGYDATTAFALPSPPSNIRQDGEMIIGISTLWDAPEKTNQLHIQLFYGDQVLYDEYAPGSQTARVFPVPMASTNYLLRIRAGNPAGWSEWAETVVYTEKYPLIDSRLGVMATTYQESYLYPDTWDGGTDLPGVGVPQEMAVMPQVEINEFYEAPRLDDMSAATGVAIISPVQRRVLKQSAEAEPEFDSASCVASITGVTRKLIKIAASYQEEPQAASGTAELNNIMRIKLKYSHAYAEHGDAASGEAIITPIIRTLIE